MSVSNIFNSSFQIPSLLAGGGGPTPPPAGAITQINTVANSNMSVSNPQGPNAVISTTFLQNPVCAEFYSTQNGVSYISTNSGPNVLTSFELANNTYISQTGATPDFIYTAPVNPNPGYITINVPGSYLINYKVNLVNQNAGTAVPTQPQSYAYVKLVINGSNLQDSATVLNTQYDVTTVEGSYIYTNTSTAQVRIGFSTRADTASSVALWAGPYEPLTNIPVSALITFQKIS